MDFLFNEVSYHVLFIWKDSLTMPDARVYKTK